MTKYKPLFELHQLVQLTHSTSGKAIFYSQVHLALDDNVDEDEAGGWILSAFTGKTYFEREYRRDDLDDLVRGYFLFVCLFVYGCPLHFFLLTKVHFSRLNGNLFGRYTENPKYNPTSFPPSLQLMATGDKDWISFAKRFRKAVLEGYFHIVDMNSRECKVIIDNEVHSRTTRDSQSPLETIAIDMHPVSHTSRSEKIGEFMFEVLLRYSRFSWSLVSNDE